MSATFISKSLREKIAEQGRRRCGYCLTSETIVGAPMEIDHSFTHRRMLARLALRRAGLVNSSAKLIDA